MYQRKLDLSDLEIVEVERGSGGAIIVTWSSSNIGFGEFTLYFGEDKKLHGDTESMDSNDDKAFTKKILELLSAYINIDR